MSLLHRRGAFVVWLVLCLLTIVSVALVERAGAVAVSSIAVIAIAMLKVELVMRHYMEVRSAGRPWHYLYGLWNSVVAVALVWGYFQGAG